MIFELIPHHDGVMSIYTICGFTIAIIFITIYIRYNSNEFRRIEKWMSHYIKKLEEKCEDHDDYIDNATSVINKIHIDLAVQEASMKDLKADITEIKEDVKTLLKRQ